MPTNTASKNFASSLDLDSADRDNDAAHVCRGTIVAHLDGDDIGVGDENVLIAVPQTDITVTRVRLQASLTVSKSGNRPIITVKTGDLAAGSLTACSTVHDLASAELTAQTAVSGTVSAGSVTAGTGIYLCFAKQGTPAVIGTSRLTLLIDYDLAN